MSSEFDTDTTVERIGDNRWWAQITPRWNIGEVPNGGYLLATAGRVLAETLPQPDPLSVTAHYIRRAEAGPTEFEFQAMREGRNVSTGMVTMHQDGQEVARILGAYTDLADRQGKTIMQNGPPELPPLEECVTGQMPIEISKRFAFHFTQDSIQGFLGKPGDKAEIEGYVGFTDGREPDSLALLLIADACPPPIFNRVGIVGWVPTIELTVHVRARPAPGLLKCRFATRYLTDGLMEEDGEIWDSEDKLVALSRQMATLRLPKT